MEIKEDMTYVKTKNNVKDVPDQLFGWQRTIEHPSFFEPMEEEKEVKSVNLDDPTMDPKWKEAFEEASEIGDDEMLEEIEWE